MEEVWVKASVHDIWDYEIINNIFNNLNSTFGLNMENILQ